MIIRILGERQYDVPDGELTRLNALDAELNAAVRAGDRKGCAIALRRLLNAVRVLGTPVPTEAFVTSDMILPDRATALEEVAGLLGDRGLIAG
ncbi:MULTISPECIES: PspA-associated protein PspAA [Thermomonospora]|uniref:PspA-associated domain-containing protein n=1 Tax=Thermomonospora curvata (strain ATCC 19995 / DSM 43183 / JCM 3096 / KCTC 9072 / NBRC 15933 / NCIMB 10081 / Henssen B9) TaxID=471852 RepID=D1AEM5_THECD|nr:MULTISPECIES: hypothetical protein [Thermomonospora]ACY97600.1 hypothetical protein Tcur_2033 [Thermomonospora curvata DSM 43183]PKK14544.1 MAG: hypothetical protein BUE48_009935 [Thermomonospora sp. CIF 1]